MPLSKDTIRNGLSNPEWLKSFLHDYCQQDLETKTKIRIGFSHLGPDVGNGATMKITNAVLFYFKLNRQAPKQNKRLVYLIPAISN